MCLDISKLDGVIMTLKQLACDIKPKPPTFVAFSRIEGLKYVWGVICANAGPVVRKNKVAFFSIKANLNFFVGAVGRFEPIDCVVEKIQQKLEKHRVSSLRDQRRSHCFNF